MGIVPLETKSANDKMLVYDSGIVQKLGDGQTPWTDREMNKCVKQFKELHNLKSVKPTKNDPAELYCTVECNLNRDNFSMYERLHSLPKVKIRVKMGDNVLTCIGIVDTGSNRTLAPRKIFEGRSRIPRRRPRPGDDRRRQGGTSNQADVLSSYRALRAG